jgi:hypothetical protein
VGAYYKGGLTAIDGVVVEGYDRAAPAGVGPTLSLALALPLPLPLTLTLPLPLPLTLTLTLSLSLSLSLPVTLTRRRGQHQGGWQLRARRATELAAEGARLPDLPVP